jgi:hypothetical protein
MHPLLKAEGEAMSKAEWCRATGFDVSDEVWDRWDKLTTSVTLTKDEQHHPMMFYNKHKAEIGVMHSIILPFSSQSPPSCHHMRFSDLLRIEIVFVPSKEDRPLVFDEGAAIRGNKETKRNCSLPLFASRRIESELLSSGFFLNY